MELAFLLLVVVFLPALLEMAVDLFPLVIVAALAVLVSLVWP